MRFKVDESLHVEVADLLRGQGHDALTVFDQGLRGRNDHALADICRTENRVLLSLDLDFSNILMFPPRIILAWLFCGYAKRVGQQSATLSPE